MANRCLNLPQQNDSVFTQTLASAISTKRRRFTHLVFTYRCVHRSTIFGTKLILNRSESTRKHQPVKRDVTATSDAEFSDDVESNQNYDVLDGIREAGESAYCSVKKAFSSMVFIIRELQSFTIKMREALFYEDLQDIVVRVQKEMNASFVWLFRQVFSQTPNLMVFVMILLANYSVHSISHNFAAAAAAPPPAAVASITKFDSSSIEKFCGNSGGNNGGGGKLPAVASGTHGDGRFDRSLVYSSEIVSPARSREESWNWIVDEADRMQGVFGDEGLDREMMRRFVSPVTVRIEEEDAGDYLRTEVVYQTGLLQEPDNPLLLANYAQFLYLVARDYDRAEDYFKRASMVEPKAAEALNKYASFLWLIRKDLWAAEETYLEAISADPNNSFYVANYAHFLWNTGGEDTCFPLDSSEDTFSSDV